MQIWMIRPSVRLSIRPDMSMFWFFLLDWITLPPTQMKTLVIGRWECVLLFHWTAECHVWRHKNTSIIYLIFKGFLSNFSSNPSLLDVLLWRHIWHFPLSPIILTVGSLNLLFWEWYWIFLNFFCILSLAGFIRSI